VRFPFTAMDAWFEEDEQVYGEHPRSPFVRIDVLGSSRRVRVEVEGTLVAESANCRFLYETGLQTRYYMPKTSVGCCFLFAWLRSGAISSFWRRKRWKEGLS
jgi:uncharacterized protein (DUF427 family)